MYVHCIEKRFYHVYNHFNIKVKKYNTRIIDMCAFFLMTTNLDQCQLSWAWEGEDTSVQSIPLRVQPV